MKKIVSLVVLLAFCVVMFPFNAFAYEGTIFVTINGVEKELGVNYDMLWQKDLLVYGTPQDVYGYPAEPAQSYDSATGEWRYLGFTENKFPFSNMNYPNDIAESVDRMIRDYVEFPWTIPLIACPRNEWIPSEYQWNAIKPYLIDLGYPPHMTDYSAAKTYWSIQFWPSSSGTFLEGSLREWHLYDGYPYYETHQVQFPEDIGLNTRLIVEPPTATVKVGGTTNYKAYLDYAGNGRDSSDPEVTTNCVWTTAIASIGTIDRSLGKAFGKSVGETEVTASYTKDGRNLSGSAVLIVVDNMKPADPTIPIPDLPPEPTSGNLSVTGVTVVDSNGSPVTKNQLNGQYKIRVAVKNHFNEGGFAQVGVYMNGNRYESYKSVYLESGGTMTMEWTWPGTGRDVDIMGVVNIVPLASGAAQPDFPGLPTGWNVYKFNDKYESYYDDNYLFNIIVGDDKPSGPPPPGDEVHPARYQQVTLEWQDNWTKIPIIFDDTKRRVTTILVPTPTEEE